MSEGPEDDFALTSERSFSAALRALWHLSHKLQWEGTGLHVECELCDVIRKFLSVPYYEPQNAESEFLTARNALKHLYTQVEAAGIELDTAGCDACNEIREFLYKPDYRGQVPGSTLIYCDNCERHQPLRIDPMTRHANNNIGGDLVCGVCHYIVTTLTVREEGEYEFVKVQNVVH